MVWASRYQNLRITAAAKVMAKEKAQRSNLGALLRSMYLAVDVNSGVSRRDARRVTYAHRSPLPRFFPPILRTHRSACEDAVSPAASWLLPRVPGIVLQRENIRSATVSQADPNQPRNRSCWALLSRLVVRTRCRSDF